MSDADEEIAALGQHALRTARVAGLRERMSEFVDAHQEDIELEELRAGVDSMAELVDEERTERL